MGRVASPIAEGARGLGDRVYEVTYNQVNLLRFPSMLGLPACSIPNGFDAAGLPIGLQIIGPWYHDQMMLDAALAVERVADWRSRWPALVD